MESDLPIPIDDSITYNSSPPPPRHIQEEEIYNEEDEEPRHHQYQHQQYQHQQYQQQMYQQQSQQQQSQKKGDIFPELDKIHWIILVSAILLAFFMGKSISTPIIIKST